MNTLWSKLQQVTSDPGMSLSTQYKIRIDGKYMRKAGISRKSGDVIAGKTVGDASKVACRETSRIDSRYDAFLIAFV